MLDQNMDQSEWCKMITHDIKAVSRGCEIHVGCC
jgi:hypothetical protein